MSLKIRWMAILAVAASTVLSVPALPHSQAQERAATPAQGPLRFTKGSLDHFSFKMVRSTAVVQAGCLLTATGAVTITRQAQNDVMQVSVSGVAPNTGFDLFVIQIPDKPFGVAWYQSDLQTGATGSGSVTVRGIFNAETFSISQGGVAGGSQTGATKAVTSTNVTFQPTNQYHLGLWFGSPTDAVNNGCPNTVTPFNGAQNAGIQALSTRNFAAGLGPLAAIRP